MKADSDDDVNPKPAEPDRGDAIKPESPQPANPDVFSTPEDEKKGEEELENRDKLFRDILRELRWHRGGNINYYFYGSVVNSAVGSDSQVNIDEYKQQASRKMSGLANAKETKSDVDQIKTIENVRKWFFDKKSVEQTFILAFTFFSGASLQFINCVSDELQKKLGVVKKVEDEVKTSIFGNAPSIDELLAESFADVKVTSLNTEMGLTTYQAVVFQNQRIYSLFNDLIINDSNFIKIIPNLRIWLLDIINSSNQTLLSMGALNSDLVRTQAALGIGFLAGNEFSGTLNSIIRPWATSDDPYKRLMVGWILLGYLDSGDLLESRWPNILSLIKHWSSVGNYRLQWTSIATTTRLGLLADSEHSSYLRESLKIIKSISQSKQVASFKTVIAKSLQLIFSMSPYHAEAVIMEFESWLPEKSNFQLPDLAAELFVLVADQRLDVDNQNDDRSKSILIWSLCDPDKKFFEAVYALLRQVFIHRKGSFVDFSMIKIVDWINMASRHGDEKNLIYLLRKLYANNETSRYILLILNSEKIKDPRFYSKVVC